MRFKLFTIAPPVAKHGKDKTLLVTVKEINDFLNSQTEDVHPTDISAEYNEGTNKMLISIGYKDQPSILESITSFLKKRLKGNYQVRFEDLYEYNEKDHKVYIQLELENAVNYNVHETISHGIYVQDGRAKVVFLEHEKNTNEE